MVNNALACVKMNTVIGINDLVGDQSGHNEVEKGMFQMHPVQCS